MSIQSQQIANLSPGFRSTRSSPTLTGFEQSLARASLRRVEEKEFLLQKAIRSLTSIGSRPERSRSSKFSRMAGGRSWALPILATSSVSG